MAKRSKTRRRTFSKRGNIATRHRSNTRTKQSKSRSTGRLARISNQVRRYAATTSSPASKLKSIVKNMAISDAIVDGRSPSGLYDPVLCDNVDVKFKVILPASNNQRGHCFHIDTIEMLLDRKGIRLDPISLRRAARLGETIQNPLTREDVHISTISDKLIYIIHQPYYKQHKGFLREMVYKQLKIDTKQFVFDELTQEGTFVQFSNEHDNKLILELVKVLFDAWSQMPTYAVMIDAIDEILYPENTALFTPQLKALIRKENTKENWEDFSKRFNSELEKRVRDKLKDAEQVMRTS